MKLLTFDEFCALPDGVVFQQWKPHYLESLSIRGDVLRDGSGTPVDFLMADLMAAPLDGDMIGRKELQSVFCHPSAFGRWALYDKEYRYLVYESDDRARLAMWLLNPHLALDGMNEDGATTVRAEAPL